MAIICVLNRTRQTVLGHRVRLANTLPGRVRGFLFRPPPGPGEGILLSPCRAVHMYGVRFPLDVVFISETGQVVATYRRLRPWQRSGVHGSAFHALELPPGVIEATGTVVGDHLSWAAAEDNPAGTAGEAGEVVEDAAVAEAGGAVEQTVVAEAAQTPSDDTHQQEDDTVPADVTMDPAPGAPGARPRPERERRHA